MGCMEHQVRSGTLTLLGLESNRAQLCSVAGILTIVPLLKRSHEKEVIKESQNQDSR